MVQANNKKSSAWKNLRSRANQRTCRLPVRVVVGRLAYIGLT